MNYFNFVFLVIIVIAIVAMGIKGMWYCMITAYKIFLNFIETYRRIPTVTEFEDLGYSRMSYYRSKRKYMSESRGK